MGVIATVPMLPGAAVNHNPQGHITVGRSAASGAAGPFHFAETYPRRLSAAAACWAARL
jgi:hypothetical protein